MKNEINIDIPNGFEIDAENSNLSIGKIVFKPIEPIKEKYPMSVAEIKGRKWFISGSGRITTAPSNYIDENQLKTRELASAFLALMQLKTICDEWNRIDGFVVDWTNGGMKYCVCFTKGKLCVDWWYFQGQALTFQDEKTATLFLNSFRELLETAKPLL